MTSRGHGLLAGEASNRRTQRRSAGLLTLLLVLAACTTSPNGDSNSVPTPTIGSEVGSTSPLDGTQAPEQGSTSRATPKTAGSPLPEDTTSATARVFSSAAAEIGEVVWTTAVDPTTKAPTERVTKVQTDAEAIYAALPVARIQEGTVISAHWTYNETAIEGLGTEITADAAAVDLWLEFHIVRTGTEPWPAGTYAVSIAVDDQPAQEAAISVQPIR